MTDRDADSRRTTKVERVIEKYDLDGIGAELEASWTGDGRERQSLRDLAEHLNRELVQSALRSAGLHPLDHEGENYYELLTSEEPTGAAVEVEARLERDGVDVEDLTNDFVTYQAMRNYLTDVRGASYEKASDEDQVTKEREAMEQLITRTENVANEKLGRLARTGRMTLGSFRLFVSVQVLCEDCDNQYGVVELLRRGGCECEAD